MHTNVTIIVVEDEPRLRDDLVEFLGMQGFNASGASSVAEYEQISAAGPFDILLLDINLPDGDGYEIARGLRAREGGRQPGIVMLTCREGLDDRIAGLECGADAYLAKNADLREIEATIRSLVRRMVMGGAADDALSPVWRLDSVACSIVAQNGEAVPLTAMEVSLMKLLMEAPGRAFPRDDILAALGKEPRLEQGRSIDTLVSRVRKKVEENTGMPLPVSKVYGVGYQFSAQAVVN